MCVSGGVCDHVLGLVQRPDSYTNYAVIRDAQALGIWPITINQKIRLGYG